MINQLEKKIRSRKAETQTNIIMWIGIIIAVFISVLWVMKNINPRHLDLETVNSDLEDLQGHFNSACSSAYYKAKFNPKTINGKLIINDSSICIENSFNKCRLAMCNIGENIVVQLQNITYIVIEKNESYEVYSE